MRNLVASKRDNQTCSHRARQPEVVVKSSSDVQQRQCCRQQGKAGCRAECTRRVLDQSFMNKVNQQMLKRAKDFGLDDLDVNISVIPNRVYMFDNQTMN